MKKLAATKIIMAAVLLAAVASGCGGSGGSADPLPPQAPVLAITTPTNASRVTDVNFQDQSFTVQASYSGDHLMDFSTLDVKMSVNDGANVDITSYFTKVDEATIKSSNLYQYTRTLFDLSDNSEERSVVVIVYIKTQAGVAGDTQVSITVYPESSSPPVPPPGAAK